jgi:hypothetical protein
VTQAYRALLCAALLALCSACAHEVVVLEAPSEELERPTVPLGLTVSVLPGSFDRCRLQPRGVLERFSDSLRESRLFQGVLYPVPRDVQTDWEIELLAADEIWEPNSNVWKAFFATALLPTALFLKLENDYTLQLEVLLLQRRTVVGSYRGHAKIRHRYGRYANRAEVDAEGVETAVRVATEAALRKLGGDLERLRGLAR